MRQSVCILPALLAFSALASGPQLSPNAPKDKPVIYMRDDIGSLSAAMAPHIAQAKSTYPAAKARFLAGLPLGQIFFVTTRLHDNTGAVEQVFIQVSSIRDGQITGRIASQIRTVPGYETGGLYTFRESDLLDWLITHEDGSEEGNYVGKFLDNYHGGGA